MRFDILILSMTLAIGLSSCNNDPDEQNPPDVSGCQLEEISESSNVSGYGILGQLPGIWNGPVTSPTPLGSFQEWIVDFRPISSAQVSAKNELDSLNDIFMSFFIIKHDCEYKMAFRNGGGFAGLTRNSYMIIDSVDESSAQSFYRFVDPVSGGNRVYTDVRFNQDSLIMVTYTNQYNTLSDPSIHMHWRAKLQDQTSTTAAILAFNYPQKELVRDFSTTFDNVQEAVFYNGEQDPYPESEQPYLGQSTLNVNISSPASPDPSKKVLIVLTTQPLFNGFVFQSQNLKYRSRYVFVGAQNPTGYTFNYMHPGTYYINVLYDEDGNLNFDSGDYTSSNFDTEITLNAEGTASASVAINFQIP